MSIATGTNFIYKVQPGDTLYSIAARFGSSIQAIANANYLTVSDLIYPGQILVVPSVSAIHTNTFYVVAPGDRLYYIAQRFSTYVDLLVGINPGLQNVNLIYPGQRLLVPAFIYQVEPNDTLYQIETRFGIHRSDIIRANLDRPRFSPDVIYPGFSLIIPLPTSENIAVFTPFPGTVIRSGQRVAGSARAFEGNILHQVRDNNGVIVSEERAVTASAGAPAFGWFADSLPFDRRPTADSGEVWVYTRGAAANEIQNLVRIKVYFDTVS